MAMTYTESATLMQDLDFRGRIKVSSLNYAKYILGEPVTTTAHNTRYNWAQNTARQPDSVATQLQPNVVMQDLVQEQGSAISDADLDTAVQIVVNQLL